MKTRVMVLAAVIGATMVVGMAMFASSPASASSFSFVDCSTITAGSPAGIGGANPVPGSCVIPPTAGSFSINTLNSSLTYESTDHALQNLVVTGWTGLPGGTIPTNIQIKNDTTVSGEVGLGLAKNPPDFEIF